MESVQDNRGFAAFAIFAAILLHLLLLWVVLQQQVRYTPPPRFIAVDVVHLPPPPAVPKPKPKPVVLPKPAPKVVIQVHPVPVPHVVLQHRAPVRSHVSAPRIYSAPPAMHFGSAGTQAGLGLDLGTPAGGTGQGSMDGFDDSVKQRIEAAKTYPPAMPYMPDECIIFYSVTVDRTGAFVNYKLWGCHNPFLDSAARAAILSASPFPVPPNFGGDQYTVFGSLVFKH